MTTRRRLEPGSRSHRGALFMELRQPGLHEERKRKWTWKSSSIMNNTLKLKLHCIRLFTATKHRNTHAQPHVDTCYTKQTLKITAKSCCCHHRRLRRGSTEGNNETFTLVSMPNCLKGSVNLPRKYRLRGELATATCSAPWAIKRITSRNCHTRKLFSKARTANNERLLSLKSDRAVEKHTSC